MSRQRWRRHGAPLTLVAALGAALMLTACAPSDPPEVSEATDGAAADEQEQRYPDVLSAELGATGETWRLSATLSSPYDTPERYADAFRALAEDGTPLGVRELAHDHANEQPFTRSLAGLLIPDDVERITVQGRDQRYGWGGATVELEVPPSPAADS